MSKLRHITVASDLSPQAGVAVRRALQLARQHSGSLLALSVVPPLQAAVENDWWSREGLTPEQLQAQVLSETEARLRQSIGDAHTGLDARVVVSRSAPHVEIVSTARSEGSDLVVVGAHGGHFLHRLLVGTTAERVVRHAERPVLVVKQSAGEAYRRVLVPVDFSPLSQAALGFAQRIAPEAEISVVHSYELWFESWIGLGYDLDERVLALRDALGNEARARLAEVVRGGGLDPAVTTQVVRYGYPGRIITRVADDLNADLIVMGTHGHTCLFRALIGSTAQKMVQESTIPVLVVRIPEN